MAVLGIYTSPYPIEKVGDSPYPYPNPVNAGIPRQNGEGSGNTHGAGLFVISTSDDYNFFISI